MPWGELVHIVARYFAKGEHPWTNEDFYAQSWLPSEADVTMLVDPIILTLFEHEGPRYAPSWNWWDCVGHFWSVDEVPLDAEYRLTSDVVRFTISILEIGGNSDDSSIGLLPYEVCSMGLSDTFRRPFADDIKAAADFARSKGKDNPTNVRFLTLWQCDAGRQYIPGEPDEYYEDWQLMGIVTPQAETVTFEPLPEPADPGAREG
jgi:hypothetical protein